MSDEFDEFVKRQIESSTSDGSFDLEKEKSIWLGKVEQLYDLRHRARRRVRRNLSRHSKHGYGR
jgi:hypothetical protein